MEETNQIAVPRKLTSDDLAEVFLEFLAESPRSYSVREWATDHGIPTTLLRGWQRDRFISWLRVPKDNRQPKTQGLLAEYLGISENTLSTWSQLPEVIQAVGRGVISAVQELAPAAVKKLEDELSSVDGLDAAKFIVKASIQSAMPSAAPIMQTNVTVNNKVDAAIQSIRFSCGHTYADHGPYDYCPDLSQSVIDLIPETKSDTQMWGTYQDEEENEQPVAS